MVAELQQAEVPYGQDTEYWVRFLQENWVPEVIPPEVVAQIRGAANMFEARGIAMVFHNNLLVRDLS